MQIMLFRLEISSGEDGAMVRWWDGRMDVSLSARGRGIFETTGRRSKVLECWGVLLLKFPEVASVDCSLLTYSISQVEVCSIIYLLLAAAGAA